MAADGCPGRVRHWRAVLGVTGYRAPACVYCGSPNPRPLSEREWADLIRIAAFHNVGDHVRTAIEERQRRLRDKP
jgi:hypothetical protein